MEKLIFLCDFLLVPVYLLLFYLIVRKKAKKYNGTPLKKFFYLAFWLHMIGALFISLLIQYYYGSGDSFSYYDGGEVIRDIINKNIFNLKYLFYSGKAVASAAEALGYGDRIPMQMSGNPNAVIMKISAILSYFSFNSFLVISLFFGFFSFIGTWKLFYVFQELNKGRYIQLLGYSTICTPSLWLYGSGLQKEPICIGTLGLAIFIFNKMFIKKHFSLKNLILLLLLLYIIMLVKNYIIAIFIASVAMVFFIRIFALIKNFVLRAGTITMFVFIAFIFFTNQKTQSYIDDMVSSSYSQIENFKDNYDVMQGTDENSKGGFSIGDINPTFSSLVLQSPQVIASCLFRPFIWESKKIFILFAALEGLIIFFTTLIIFFKTKFIYFFYYVFDNPYRLFCFIFSMLFALVVGYTTFNFGAMIRYRIILLPFYFFLLINIYNELSLKKDNDKYTWQK